MIVKINKHRGGWKKFIGGKRFYSPVGMDRETFRLIAGALEVRWASIKTKGALSAFHLYTQLYEYINQIVVVDDVDLFKDKSSVNLLKCLCNTDSSRKVFWGKRNKQLDNEGIPHQFTTLSRVCVLVNTLDSIEANLAAVLDRAFVIHFRPSIQALHEEVIQWFGDAEVYDFIGENLSLVTQPSMRLYSKAAELRRLGTDWRGWLIRQWTADDPKLGFIAEVMTDTTLETAEQRVARFAELGGGARAT